MRQAEAPGGAGVKCPEAFEERIGYRFKDGRRLNQALTHSSYANEHGLERDYERLEFLGDAVLELLVSDMLFKQFPDMSEGDLTKMRASMVCEASLAGIAREIGIGAHMLLGHGEEQSGGRERSSILADAMEAVIGAVYVDGGIFGAQKLVKLLLGGRLAREAGVLLKNDHKSQLQEILQRDSAEPVVYHITGVSGPDHQRTFTAEVSHRGKVLGVGRGNSKKAAEQCAALCAINKRAVESALKKTEKQ